MSKEQKKDSSNPYNSEFVDQQVVYIRHKFIDFENEGRVKSPEGSFINGFLCGIKYVLDAVEQSKDVDKTLSKLFKGIRLPLDKDE